MDTRTQRLQHQPTKTSDDHLKTLISTPRWLFNIVPPPMKQGSQQRFTISSDSLKQRPNIYHLKIICPFYPWGGGEDEDLTIGTASSQQPWMGGAFHQGTFFNQCVQIRAHLGFDNSFWAAWRSWLRGWVGWGWLWFLSKTCCCLFLLGRGIGGGISKILRRTP